MRVLGKMANAATRGLRKPAFWRGVISIPAFLLFWRSARDRRSGSA